MSFGFSVGDFVAAGNHAWSLYRQCKGASAEFQEASNEVISLETCIREPTAEAENNESILNCAGRGRKQELDTIMRGCTEVLFQFENLLTRYRFLGMENKRTWDRARFSSDDVQAYRNKLLFHTSSLTLFLTSLSTRSLCRIEKKLDNLATILDRSV